MDTDAAAADGDTASQLERRRAARREATARCRARKRQRAGDGGAVTGAAAVTSYLAPGAAAGLGDLESQVRDLVDERLHFYFGQQQGDPGEEEDAVLPQPVDRLSDFSGVPTSVIRQPGNGYEKVIMMALVPLLPRLAVMVTELLTSAARSGRVGDLMTAAGRAVTGLVRAATAVTANPPPPTPPAADGHNRPAREEGPVTGPVGAVAAPGAGADPHAGKRCAPETA